MTTPIPILFAIAPNCTELHRTAHNIPDIPDISLSVLDLAQIIFSDTTEKSVLRV